MNTDVSEQQMVMVNPERLMALVRTMMDGKVGREGDDQPLPPGPWDPVIRSAFEKVNVFSPHPEPWRVVFASILARHPEIWDVIGGGHNYGDEASLNPQPLPPRAAFMTTVAQAVISRAELFQEIADATAHEGEQQGIIIVSGYISRFVDDFCGTGFRLKYPFPGPRPHWFAEGLDAIDFVVLATQFNQAAKETYSPDLRQNLAEASAKFLEAGFSKMQ